MDQTCLYLLIPSMFFSFSAYSHVCENTFEEEKIRYDYSLPFVKVESAETVLNDTIVVNAKNSNGLIHRHSLEKDSTGIRYTKKYSQENFPYFNFRVSKNKVYHKLDDFNSDQAKELFVLAKNDQFNSDSLSREVNLLYTKKGVYSDVDEDLFKRRVHDLEKRSEELKKNASQKVKHTIVLEKRLEKSPNLILAATHDIATPEYKGGIVVNEKKDVIVPKKHVSISKAEVEFKEPVSSDGFDVSSHEDEGGYLDFEYEYCYQIAVFDKRPTNDFYKGMGFIKEEIVDGGKSFRYLTGSYRTYAKASGFKTKIKTIFPAAFIVVYKNGIRTNIKDAIFETDKPATVSTSNSIPKYASNFTGEVSYRVQVGVFAGEIPEELNTTMERYKAFGSFYENRSDGKIVCTIGRFKTISEVASLKKKLQESGYADAFTVAYSGQKRVSLQASIKKTENRSVSKSNKDTGVIIETITEADLAGEINFRVQVGVFSNGVPDRISELMTKYKVFGTSAMKQTNGNIVCTIGQFDSIADAGSLKKKLYNDGFTDIFTAAYTGNKRISIKDAIRLIK